MAEAFIVRRGGAASLNYKVVGSTSMPANPKENTIWVNTKLEREALAKLNTERLALYINNSTGKVTSPSSNTCYTRFFECVAGRKYRFCLSDGQTVLIAGFTEKPAAGVIGTVLYGSGKTNGADSLDHSLTAASGTKYLAIWYYDSSANDSVPTLTVTDETYMNSLPTTLAVTGHCFSANVPASPQNGMLWFRTGTESQAPFNALKKNSAMLYPRSCAQYYMGSWLNCRAKTYIGGEWKDWRQYLFENGTDNTALTGGYVGTGSYGAYKIADGLLFAYPKGGGTTGACRTVNPIDLRGYNTLYFDVKQMNAGTFYLGVTDTTGTATEDFVSMVTGSQQSGLIAVDISNLGELSVAQGFYVVMRVAGGSTSKGVKLSAVYLE